MSKGKHRRKLRRDRILEGSAGSPFARTLLWSKAAAETLRETEPGWFWSTVTAMILTQMLPAMLYLAWMDATLRVSGWMALVLLLGVCFSLASRGGAGQPDDAAAAQNDPLENGPGCPPGSGA